MTFPTTGGLPAMSDWTTAEGTYFNGTGTIDTTTHTLAVYHGLQDERGRPVGGRAVIHEGARGGSVVYVYATRNGKNYGASPRGQYANTVEGAKALGEAALARQGKAYARKYATLQVTA